MQSSFDSASFPEEISSLSLSAVFLYFFPVFIEEDALVSLAILWKYSALSWVKLSLSPLLFTSVLSSALYKASSNNCFAFLHFFPSEHFCSLLPIQYYESLSIVLLFTRSIPLNLFVTSTV